MNLTIIGAGKMGEALARNIVQSGLVSPANLTLTDVVTERAQALAAELGAVVVADNITAVRQATVVILAAKPKDIAGVCEEISPALPPQAIVLSLAAGITLRLLATALGRDDLNLARTMPNLPCLVGAGAFGLSFPARTSADARHIVSQLLSSTGIVEEVPESLLDAVTGLSGSGPAYVAVFIEALADGAVLMGLPRSLALQFAKQTVFGTAKYLLETGQHPAQLKDDVSSPGGTTITALAALEEHGFRAAAIDAVKAASMRARALSGE